MKRDEMGSRGCLVAGAGEPNGSLGALSGLPMRSVMDSLKKVYENALAHEMRKCGIGVVQQRGIVVFYDDVIVGE
jgi:hypothetical protein